VGLARLAEWIRPMVASTVALMAGMWLIVAPFALVYGFGANSTRATFNDLVTGLLVVAVTVVGHAGARMAASTWI
jgi:SPW repeat